MHSPGSKSQNGIPERQTSCCPEGVSTPAIFASAVEPHCSLGWKRQYLKQVPFSLSGDEHVLTSLLKGVGRNWKPNLEHFCCTPSQVMGSWYAHHIIRVANGACCNPRSTSTKLIMRRTFSSMLLSNALRHCRINGLLEAADKPCGQWCSSNSPQQLRSCTYCPAFLRHLLREQNTMCVLNLHEMV